MMPLLAPMVNTSPTLPETIEYTTWALLPVSASVALSWVTTTPDVVFSGRKEVKLLWEKTGALSLRSMIEIVMEVFEDFIENFFLSHV